MNSGLALGYEVQSFVAAPFHMTLPRPYLLVTALWKSMVHNQLLISHFLSYI